ncbi:MAG: hypothetical protein K0R34_2489 [Herbinix sp.]|jgi:hypothetical protein|nr:hypothetical protein [Herbinix sp.]
MEYDNRLINIAISSRCKICGEYITEQEAIDKGFQAAKTSRGGYSFIHNRCWERERNGVYEKSKTQATISNNLL